MTETRQSIESEPTCVVHFELDTRHAQILRYVVDKVSRENVRELAAQSKEFTEEEILSVWLSFWNYLDSRCPNLRGGFSMEDIMSDEAMPQCGGKETL